MCRSEGSTQAHFSPGWRDPGYGNSAPGHGSAPSAAANLRRRGDRADRRFGLSPLVSITFAITLSMEVVASRKATSPIGQPVKPVIVTADWHVNNIEQARAGTQ